MVHVIEADLDEQEWLRELLTFEQSNFRGGSYSTDYYSLLYANGTFPVGLIGTVLREAKRASVPVSLEDARVQPVPDALPVNTGWLYDFQQEAVDTLLDKTLGIVKAPTGSGKTEIMVGCCVSRPGLNWGILTPNDDLLINAAERFEKRTGLVPGVIGNGQWDTGPVTVASFHTLWARFKSPQAQEWLASLDGIICDESHTVAADTFWAVAMAAANAYYRLGVSATPLDRMDRRSVNAVAALGRVVYEIPAQTLIDRGIIAEPVIRMVPLEQHPKPRVRPKFADVYKEVVVNSPDRNALVLDMMREASRPFLAFTKTIPHGKALTSMARGQGHRVAFVDGSVHPKKRQEIIRRVINGSLDGVISTKVFSTGIDIPPLAAVINAAGGKSAIEALQRIGRGSRSDQGRKATFEVWDVWDEGNRWMRDHSKARARAYHREGYNVGLGPVTGATVPWQPNKAITWAEADGSSPKGKRPPVGELVAVGRVAKPSLIKPERRT